MRRWTRSVRPESKRTTRYLPRRSTRVDALAHELGGDLERIERSRQPRIVDLDLDPASSLQRRRESRGGRSRPRGAQARR